MSDSRRSDRVRELFEEVTGLEAEERVARLAEACGDDEEFRRKVESLLEAADARGSNVRRALEGLRPLGETDHETPTPGAIPAGLQDALKGRYTIEREIGRGGMATVYRAADLRHRRKVAIKVLNPDLSQALGSKRFLREIEVAANFNHPHILPLFDSGEAAGFVFYVMPCVEGESLRARLDRELQLPLEEAIQIAREIADALAHAHDKGVTHRDVKPANILLEGGHAVLADFGVAKAIANLDRTPLTQAGTSLGTPGYMSPEQASGAQSLDGRSDQYALACVLYEALTGEPPFRGARAEAVVRQHLTANPTPVTQVRPSVPEGVAEALRRALSKNPADRFRTTRAFGQALDEGLRTSHVGLGEGEKVNPRVSRSLMTRGALLVLTALVVIAGAWAAAAILGNAAGDVDDDRPLIAVLPFDNLSPDPTYSFFAAGVREDLAYKLSRIPTLAVIARLPVAQNRRSKIGLSSATGEEIDADYLLGGSARLTGDSVRITIAVTDGATGVQVWSDRFDAGYTPEAYVRVQSEIVQRIAFELRATLSPDDLLWLEAIPTQNLEALEAYMRGNEAYVIERVNRSRADWRFLESDWWYAQAMAFDSQFSFALARLALTNAYAMWGTDNERDRVLNFARRALAITPDLPEAKLALLLASKNEKERNVEFEELQRIAPDHLEVLLQASYRQRDSGDLEAAASTLNRAGRLYPQNPRISRTLQFLYVYGHQYDKALELTDRLTALVASPAEMAPANMMRVFIHLARRDERRTHATISQMLREAPQIFYTLAPWAPHRLSERLLQPSERETAFAAAGNGVVLKILGPVVASRPSPSLRKVPPGARNYSRIAPTLRTFDQSPLLEPEERDDYSPLELWGSQAATAIHSAAEGRGDIARAYWDSLRTSVEENPESLTSAWHILAYVGLEDGEAAIAAAERMAEEALKRSCRGYYAQYSECPLLARVYAHFGEHDAAIDLLEMMLPAPSFLTVHILEVDPIWDPLRDHPRFKALLEEYANDVEH